MTEAPIHSAATAAGGKATRALLAAELGKLTLRFHGRGHKSSEGDGITAAQLEAQARRAAEER